MAMALGNFSRAVGIGGEGAWLEFARPRPQPHGAAHFVHTEKLAQLVNHAVRRGGIELGAIGAFELRNLPRILDRGALHAQADAEKWNLVLARVSNGVNHPGDPALAEAA